MLFHNKINQSINHYIKASPIIKSIAFFPLCDEMQSDFFHPVIRFVSYNFALKCHATSLFLSFQLITTTRSLVLCAESRREMEDWLTALKAASLREYYEPGLTETQDFLSNHHHWYDSVAMFFFF